MRTVVLVAVLVPLLVALGCAKKVAKNTAPAKADTAGAKPQPAAGGAKDAGKKEDAPNWLKDDRFKKDQKDQLPVDGDASSGKQPWGVGPPQGGFTAPPAAPPVQPPAAGGVPNPAPNNPPPAPAAPGAGTPAVGAKKPVVAADMKEVWIYIENASGASGKMPTSAAVYAALVEAKSPAAELVKDGAIILTGATTRESVWAYEASAYLSGGLVATQTGVETLTAAELKRRLGK